MKKYIFFNIVLLFMFSCTEELPEGFFVSQYDNKENVIEITKFIKDTLVHDSVFIINLKKKFDSNGSLLSEGLFVDDNRIGKHFFYNGGYLKYIRNYVFFNEKDLSFLHATNLFGDTLFYSQFESYLNGEIELNINGDTLFKNSSFIDLSFKEKSIRLGDSLRLNITSYDSKNNIEYMDLYFYRPENNDYLIIIHKNGNNFYLKHKTISEGENSIKGYAVITVSKVENLVDTFYESEVYKIHEKFLVY